MQLGEVDPGGIGAGIYFMLVFVVLSVFIAGLMVGRTPEYLGKKIESREVRLATLAVALSNHRNGTLRSERLGEGATDALAGAGDDRDATAEGIRDHALTPSPAKAASARRASHGCHQVLMRRSRAMRPAAI